MSDILFYSKSRSTTTLKRTGLSADEDTEELKMTTSLIKQKENQISDEEAIEMMRLGSTILKYSKRSKSQSQFTTLKLSSDETFIFFKHYDKIRQSSHCPG